MTPGGGPAAASTTTGQALAPERARALWPLPTVLQPHANLLTHYLLSSLLLGPAFPVFMVQRFFKFQTLRYALDDEGITVRWGILFRREVSLTYARIQDIHLSSNLLERWLGLARIQLQTASGSAQAEITIEGLQHFEAMRDFLYARMRGTRDGATGGQATAPGSGVGVTRPDALADALREVASEVRALREELATSAPPTKPPEPGHG
ncbi:PH domain-containing protein [Myxococcus sp. K15C18031901]|uniref:PH domain-containing protein n=1 Tax=Myxococcus dinghuensis TaxID=2906761 RepID=UPI0020A6F9AC|nr:PH domain-containing protein [Myxococcus dinghuensis]MCP3098243.1 PH domain-containing protein [Myxococcus dinghuensis]